MLRLTPARISMIINKDTNSLVFNLLSPKSAYAFYQTIFNSFLTLF